MGRAVGWSEEASLSCNWKSEVEPTVARTTRRAVRRTSAKTLRYERVCDV